MSTLSFFLISQDIKELLNQTLPGEILLLKPLEEADRNRLSEIVIVHFMRIAKPKGELNSKLLIALCEALTELFPEESAVSLKVYLYNVMCFLDNNHFIIFFF